LILIQFFISKKDIFTLIALSDIVSINGLTLIHDNIGQWDFTLWCLSYMTISVSGASHYDVYHTWQHRSVGLHIMMFIIHDNIGQWGFTLWCLLYIKTITPLLKVSSYILTNISTRAIGPVTILEIISLQLQICCYSILIYFHTETLTLQNFSNL
jgi:hypothetical protein